VLVVEAGEKEGGRRPRFSKSADAKQVALLLQKAASWESAFGEATAPPNRALIFLASMQQRHSLCWSLALRNTTSKAT